MNKELDIRVAQILEEDKIVINKGADDNIESYMEFLIYSEGTEIFDPVTGESLGKLENPKGKFKPMHIQSKMTVVVSNLNRLKNNILSAFYQQQIDVERDILKTIKVGDRVKIINKIE